MAASGTLRISHYRVEKELKRDELGYFFRAIDEQLDRPVVLRVVRASQIATETGVGPMRVRIRSNARMAAAIGHPNLVTIYEFRSLAETDLVVMEDATGETLGEARRRGQRWTVVEVARIVARLADALSAAHAAGLVHGNVNAANIRVGSDGRFRLLDLGIPKLETVDDRVPHDPSDDVRGLARLACELLGPPVHELPEGVRYRDPLSDPGLARAQFGFLSHVLTRAVKDPEGFEAASSFRDAVLQAMDLAAGRGLSRASFEGGFSTQLLGPDRHLALEDDLPGDGRKLAPLSGTTGLAGPHLALPPDLADRAGGPEHFRQPVQVSRLRSLLERIPQGMRLALAIVPVILATGGLSAWVILSRGSDVEPPPVTSAEDPENAGGGAQVEESVEPGPAPGSAAAVPGSVAPARPVDRPTNGEAGATFSAVVRAVPAGAVISVEGVSGQRWTGSAELAVTPGDSVLLLISKPGYVTQRHVFRGSRISVSLEPDSVVARFLANVPAEVFLVSDGSELRLGTTDLSVRLPTGSYRIIYRSVGQPDWESEQEMPRPGASYAITKTDYATTGDFVATVAGMWARVSVDGGPARETPARFDSLPVGYHVVTVSQDGFETITDTVLVSAGQVLRKPYTLRR